MSLRYKRLIYFFSIVISLTLFSFVLKYLTLSYFPLNGTFDGKFFTLYYLKNTGAAFSLFQNNTLFLIIITILLLLTGLVWIFKNINKLSFLSLTALTLLYSGVLGNLYERLVYGGVIDFFKLKFINFPVFNYFDILITIGIVLLIIRILIKNE